MKRFISIVCIFFVLCGMGVNPVYAAQPTQYEFFDDFESYTLNRYPTDWELVSQSDLNRVYISEDAEYTGGQYARIESQLSNSVGMMKPLPKLKGRCIFEGDFRSDDYTAKVCPYFQDENGKNAVCIQLGLSFNVYYGDPLRPTITLGSFERGSWNHLKLDIDIDNNTFDVYINGELAGSGFEFRNKVSDISKIRFSQSYVGTGIYIDNIRISGTQTLDIVTTEKSEILNNDSKKANAEMWSDLEKLEYQLKNPQYTLYSQDKLDLGMAVYTENKYTIIRNNRFKFDQENENVKAKMMNGVCMIPAETFAEFLVGEYEYDGDDFTGTIRYTDKTVEFAADNRFVTLDAKSYILKAAPVLYQKQLYVPLEDLAYIFGLNLYKDGSLYIITDKEQTIDPEGDSELISRLKRFFETRMTAEPAEIAYYVSPEGRNCWKGTLPKRNETASNGPFRTIDRARKAVKENITDDMNCDITVYIEEGQYYIDETMTFDNSDGGKNWCYVTYKNYENDEAVINGGGRITDWEQYDGNIYKAYVGTAGFKVLSENGEMVTKARYPNAGAERTDGYLTVYKDTLTPMRNFEFESGDIPELSDISDLEIYIWPGGVGGYRNWFTDTIAVTDIDYEKNTVSLASNTRYAMEPPSRYFLQGHLSFLDVPGEYYYDTKSGYLYYYPKKLPIEEQVIVVPKVSNVVLFNGESGENPIRNLVFDGVGVKNGDYKDNGCGFMLKNTANCAIKNCSVSSIGYNGIWTYGTCMNNIVYGNDIYDVGAAGIYFESGVKMGLTYYQHDNMIENNHIHDTGKLEGHGGGLTLTGTNCTARYNKIDHTGRGALSIGSGKSQLAALPSAHVGLYCEGVWISMANVRQFISGRNSSANFNEISHANLDSSDMGLFYNWGGGIDVDVKNNYFHDSDIRLQFGYCIYLDDASDMYTLQNNIIESMQMIGAGRVDSMIFMKGVGNKAINNYMVNNPNTQKGAISSLAMGGQANNSLYVTRNIAYNSGKNLHVFENWEKNRYSVSQNNIFYNPQNTEYAGVDGVGIDGVKTLEEWKNATGFDEYSKNISPAFVDAENKDFRLSCDSEAYKLGVEDLNQQDMGLKADFRYVPDGEVMTRLFVREAGKTTNSTSIDMNVSTSKCIDVFARTQNGYACDLSNARIKYTSSDSSVAQVGTAGKITAKKRGKAKISVVVEKDGVTKTSDIWVFVGDELASAALSAKTVSLVPGANTAVLAYPYSQDNRFLSKAEISYMSMDENVACVDEHGIIYGKTPGKTTVSVTASYNGKTKTVPVEVTVSENTLKYIKAEVADNVFVGKSSKIREYLYDFNDMAMSATEYSITYNSEDKAVATVDGNGVVTGVAEGDTKIDVALTYKGMEKEFVVPISVLPREGKKKETILHDDFENGIADGYVFSGDANIYEDEYTSEKSLQIGGDDGTNAENVRLTRSFDAVSGKIGISSDLFITGSGYKLGPYVADLTGKTALSLQLQYGNIVSYSQTRSETLAQYPVSVWFNLKVVADLDNKVYDVYLDGEQIGFSIPLRNDVKTISSVFFGVNGGSTGVLRMKNFEIFRPEIKP